MHDYKQDKLKQVNKLIAGATIVLGSAFTTEAFAFCNEWGDQTVPPHQKDNYRLQHAFSGGPLDTLTQCLNKIANNEDISGRDNKGMSFDYTSSARGSFSAAGVAAQPGDDLTQTNKPRNSVAIAVIESESGVSELDHGNIVEYSLATRRAKVFANWQTYQATSPNAGLFPSMPQ